MSDYLKCIQYFGYIWIGVQFNSLFGYQKIVSKPCNTHYFRIYSYIVADRHQATEQIFEINTFTYNSKTCTVSIENVIRNLCVIYSHKESHCIRLCYFIKFWWIFSGVWVELVLNDILIYGTMVSLDITESIWVETKKKKQKTWVNKSLPMSSILHLENISRRNPLTKQIIQSAQEWQNENWMADDVCIIFIRVLFFANLFATYYYLLYYIGIYFQVKLLSHFFLLSCFVDVIIYNLYGLCMCVRLLQSRQRISIRIYIYGSIIIITINAFDSAGTLFCCCCCCFRNEKHNTIHCDSDEGHQFCTRSKIQITYGSEATRTEWTPHKWRQLTN